MFIYINIEIFLFYTRQKHIFCNELAKFSKFRQVWSARVLCVSTWLWNVQPPAGQEKCCVPAVSANLRAASAQVSAPTAARREAAVSARPQSTCRRLCRLSSCPSCCVVFPFQGSAVNVTTFVPTRCACPSRQCATVWWTAKTAAMNSTAPERVSIRTFIGFDMF